jgi:hypothetical protein
VWVIVAGMAAVVAWYGLRLEARGWPPAHGVVVRCAPYTRRLHAWVLSAPATFAYIAIFTASTVVQRTAPPRLIDLLTTLQGTSLARLHKEPLSALVDSALWVADKGAGLIMYVVVFGCVVAWAERRYGTPRLIVICLSGHVLGSALTALAERHAIESGAVPHRLAVSTDVGVSYMMVAGCAAAVLVARGGRRLAGGLCLAAGIFLPIVVTHTVWDLGHLFATLCGLLTAALMLLAAPPRPRLPARPRIASVPIPGEPADEGDLV